MTIQDVAGDGSYAVPDDPPSSKKKRKEQHDKFYGTEAVQGDGPYRYYGGVFNWHQQSLTDSSYISIKTTIAIAALVFQDTI